MGHYYILVVTEAYNIQIVVWSLYRYPCFGSPRSSERVSTLQCEVFKVAYCVGCALNRVERQFRELTGHRGETRAHGGGFRTINKPASSK